MAEGVLDLPEEVLKWRRIDGRPLLDLSWLDVLDYLLHNHDREAPKIARALMQRKMVFCTKPEARVRAWTSEVESLLAWLKVRGLAVEGKEPGTWRRTGKCQHEKAPIAVKVTEYSVGALSHAVVNGQVEHHEAPTNVDGDISVHCLDCGWTAEYRGRAQRPPWVKDLLERLLDAVEDETFRPAPPEKKPKKTRKKKDA